MEERRKQGLCYNCDEKWQVGHKCKGDKLFLLEGVNEIEPKPSGIQLVEINDEEVLVDNTELVQGMKLTLLRSPCMPW